MDDIIKIGSKAPDFTLSEQNGSKVTLSELRGNKVLLSWHPLAWTGICTDQMRSLERNYEKFLEKNAIVLGLSVDTAPCKSAWAKAIVLERLKILSDFFPLGKVSKDYGVFGEAYGASKRANILIDENGIVIWAKQYEIHQLPDIDEVLAQL